MTNARYGSPGGRDARTMDALERRLAWLERAMKGMPSRWAGGAAPDLPVLLTIGSSNTIFTQASPSVTIKGIRGGVSPITAVPVLAPANLTTTYADGLVACTDEDNILVWAAGSADPGTGAVIGVTSSIPSGRTVYAMQVVEIPITGGGGATAPVHIIGWTQP